MRSHYRRTVRQNLDEITLAIHYCINDTATKINIIELCYVLHVMVICMVLNNFYLDSFVLFYAMQCLSKRTK